MDKIRLASCLGWKTGMVGCSGGVLIQSVGELMTSLFSPLDIFGFHFTVGSNPIIFDSMMIVVP
jgi:hypothetical protein